MKTKLLIIVYDAGIDEAVTETIENLELPGYTKVFGAHGVGGTGRKFGNPIWPGTNNLLYIAVSPEQAEQVRRALRDLQGNYRLKPGITLWSIDAEALE